jgi:hypothetical protein
LGNVQESENQLYQAAETYRCSSVSPLAQRGGWRPSWTPRWWDLAVPAPPRSAEYARGRVSCPRRVSGNGLPPPSSSPTRSPRRC